MPSLETDGRCRIRSMKIRLLRQRLRNGWFGVRALDEPQSVIQVVEQLPNFVSTGAFAQLPTLAPALREKVGEVTVRLPPDDALADG
jgi:hypothetical protein